MNKAELANKAMDIVLGKKVEGRIAAVLPPLCQTHDRFIVDTGTEFLEVEALKSKTYVSIMPMPPLREPAPVRDEHFSRRGVVYRPWVDGQII